MKLLNSHSDVLCTKFEHCPDARHTTGVTRILGRVGSFTRSQNYFSSGPGEDCAKSCEHWADAIARALCAETLASHKLYDSAQRCATQRKRTTCAGRQDGAGGRGHHETTGSYRAGKNSGKRTLLITLGSGGVDPDELPKLSEELGRLIIPARENLAKNIVVYRHLLGEQQPVQY